jgi:hypothetical protein
VEAPRQPTRIRNQADLLAFSQATYFVVTGVWPLIDLRSFERITGPKVDDWLVKTVGIETAVIGATLALAKMHRRITPEIEVLAAGSALGLAAIDVIYSLRRRISLVYLLDAAIELSFAAGWAAVRQKRNAA